MNENSIYPWRLSPNKIPLSDYVPKYICKYSALRSKVKIEPAKKFKFLYGNRKNRRKVKKNQKKLYILREISYICIVNFIKTTLINHIL